MYFPSEIVSLIYSFGLGPDFKSHLCQCLVLTRSLPNRKMMLFLKKRMNQKCQNFHDYKWLYENGFIIFPIFIKFAMTHSNPIEPIKWALDCGFSFSTEEGTYAGYKAFNKAIAAGDIPTMEFIAQYIIRPTLHGDKKRSNMWPHAFVQNWVKNIAPHIWDCFQTEHLKSDARCLPGQKKRPTLTFQK